MAASKAAIPASEWKWFGESAHFICGAWCRFHMATQVGDYLISTVGKYVHPSKSEGGERADHEFLRKNPNGEEIGHVADFGREAYKAGKIGRQRAAVPEPGPTKRAKRWYVWAENDPLKEIVFASEGEALAVAKGNSGYVFIGDNAAVELELAKRGQPVPTEPHGSDICVCGDYRIQHPNDGPCSICAEGSSLGDGCTGFRFSHASKDRTHWATFFGSSAIPAECKLPPAGWLCTRGAGHKGSCAAVPVDQPSAPEAAPAEHESEQIAAEMLDNLRYNVGEQRKRLEPVPTEGPVPEAVCGYQNAFGTAAYEDWARRSSAPEAAAAGDCYTRMCGCTHPLISHAVSGRCIAQGCPCTDFQEVAAPIAPAAEEVKAEMPSADALIEAIRVGNKKVILQANWASRSHRELVELLHEWHDAFYREQDRADALARAEEYRKGAKHG